jgi:hypothetical protein
MKRVVFIFAAVFMTAVLASCGGDPVSKVKKIAEQVEEEGNDWTDADQWETAAYDVLEAVEEFADSEFEEEDLSEGVEVFVDLVSALAGVDDSKAVKAIAKAGKRIEKDKSIEKRVEKVGEKLEKRVKKLKIKEDDIISKSTQKKMEKNLMKIARTFGEDL